MKFAKKKLDTVPDDDDFGFGSVAGVTEELRKKFLYMEKELNTQVIEMTEVVRGMLLAILAGRRDEDTGKLFGEHVFMISTPGAAKSYVSKKLSKLIDLKRDQFFLYQFHPFSLMENICGSYDPATFKTGLMRDLGGFLPTAVLGNLDEIFKAGPIRDVLLMILNERVFKNGKVKVDVPLLSAVSSSNEYPKSSHDAALWDRLLFRYKVQPVSSKESLKALDKIGTKPWNPDKITLKEIDLCKAEVLNVNMSDDAYDKITDIYQILAGEARIELTPRRMKAIYNVLRASAWMNGRTEVVDGDITAAIPCMWLHEDHIPVVKKLVRKISNASLDKMVSQYEAALDVYKQAKSIIEKHKMGTSSLTGLSDLFDKVTEVRDNLVKGKANADPINRVELDKLVLDLTAWHKELLPHALKDMENN